MKCYNYNIQVTHVDIKDECYKGRDTKQEEAMNGPDSK